jgi:LPXTG-motif cell wall-anchored protein
VRQRNQWKAIVVMALLLIGVGIVTPESHVARAITAFSPIGDDINGEAFGDNFGISVAMSADGNRIAIGALYNTNSAGHVRVYSWNGTAWTQTGTDIDGEAAGDQSGYSVAMSADGNRIAIGAYDNDGNGSNAGHVRVYSWNGTAWTQTGTDIDGEADGDQSGYSVAMSTDGNRIAIGGIRNDGSDNNAGHVRVYSWNGTAWTPTGTDIDGEAAGDEFGSSVAMSADGNRIAIGAPNNDGTGDYAGHVRVYSWNGTAWTPTGTDIDGEAAEDWSGYAVAMSADGNRIAIGAPFNDGDGTNAGHVRVYSWNGTAWTPTGTDIDGEAAGDQSGWSVAMSADGNRITIGAFTNDSNGNDAGHVRMYSWNSATWTQTGTEINGEAAADWWGYSVAMSADGNRIASSAISNDDSHLDAGQVRVYAVLNSPGAPTVSAVTAANGSLTVSFTAGADGGSPITNYKYSIDGTNYIALNPAATTSPFTISGLTNGTTYSVTIKASNTNGDSTASNAVAGTPVASAATPTEPNSTPAPTTVAPTQALAKAVSLPETGSNSSMAATIGLFLAIAGLVLARRRKIV